jgi:hypothetical protein
VLDRTERNPGIPEVGTGVRAALLSGVWRSYTGCLPELLPFRPAPLGLGHPRLFGTPVPSPPTVARGKARICVSNFSRFHFACLFFNFFPVVSRKASFVLSLPSHHCSRLSPACVPAAMSNPTSLTLKFVYPAANTTRIFVPSQSINTIP